MSPPPIRARDRDAILQSLRAGVVPRTGLHHVQVGRAREVESVLRDVERISDGGSAFRLVIGSYGSGKTFFLSLMRSIALERKLVATNADLNPDRRLHATGGQARSLYAELMRNLASRGKPDGGALPSVVERFATSAAEEAKASGEPTDAVIARRLASLRELVGGYDFAEVIAQYWRAHETGDEALMDAAVRWLRGEYTTKTDARHALGVRTIVDDTNVYDHLKLFARFVRLAGFGGLLVVLDEMVNLYKLGSAQARRANYEQILRILNDSMQGHAEGLGFVLAGTPEFLMDPRRGLFSYEALSSRLRENRFAGEGVEDFSGPVIRLAGLSPEDLLVLLHRLRNVHASGDPTKHLVPDDALTAFMDHCRRQVGDAAFRTPRETVRTFLDLLAALEQNPGLDWHALLGSVRVAKDGDPDTHDVEEDLADLRL